MCDGRGEECAARGAARGARHAPPVVCEGEHSKVVSGVSFRLAYLYLRRRRRRGGRAQGGPPARTSLRGAAPRGARRAARGRHAQQGKERDEDNRVIALKVMLSGRHAAVAVALSPGERGEFAKALENAIWRAKRGDL